MSSIVNQPDPASQPFALSSRDSHSLSNIWNLLGFLITFLIVFVNSADFQGSDAESFDFKYQIYLRLMVCGMAAAYGLIFAGSAIGHYLRFPGVLIPIYGLIVLSTIPFSVNQGYSLAATACLWSLFLFLPAALDRLGNERFLMALMWGTIAYVVVSWFLYLFFPGTGIWPEYISTDEYIERMGGLGHPNTLGIYAAGSMLLVLIGYRKRMVPSWAVLIWTIVWLATSYFCLSRTSFALAIIGSMAIFADRLMNWRFACFLLAALVAGLTGLVILAATGDLNESLDGLLGAVSKSGEADELTSITGRSEIWSYSLDRIEKKPVVGHGYGCQRFVMAEHSYHGHNIVLNACLGTGVVSGFVVLLIFLYIGGRLFNGADLFIRGFVPLFMISGLIESMIYSAAPSFEMVAFFALVLWRTDASDLNAVT